MKVVGRRLQLFHWATNPGILDEVEFRKTILVCELLPSLVDAKLERKHFNITLLFNLPSMKLHAMFSLYLLLDINTVNSCVDTWAKFLASRHGMSSLVPFETCLWTVMQNGKRKTGFMGPHNTKQRLSHPKNLSLMLQKRFIYHATVESELCTQPFTMITSENKLSPKIPMTNVVFITKITKIHTTDFFSFQLKSQDIKVHPSKTHSSHIEVISPIPLTLFYMYPTRIFPNFRRMHPWNPYFMFVDVLISSLFQRVN